MSRLLKFFKLIIRPNGYVGNDLYGNSYFERINPNSSRMKRSVKYVNYDDYIGGGKRISAQWYSWLCHTRQDPPSIPELEADLARQERLVQNVALIEQRDKEEALLILQQQKQATLPIPGPQDNPLKQKEILPEAPQPQAPASPFSTRTPGPEVFQPESWVPKTNIRKGE